MRDRESPFLPTAGVALLVVAVVSQTSGAGRILDGDSPREVPYGAFVVEQEVTLPGTSEEIYDAVTGDISGWWDHHFSEEPARFFIDPRPGGGFYEYFDESEDGVLHATVTYARRGELLRFVGPLGLAGNALQMSHTYRFAQVGDSTRLTVSVHGAGEVRDGWASAVDRTWHHFLVEQLKPYVESGRHREP